ncbi:MAG: eriC2 [Bacteroidetes bacterium]|jgi:CIC family chloride channel protein|nr:eriC2 [Bacteroidota bacterium]
MKIKRIKRIVSIKNQHSIFLYAVIVGVLSGIVSMIFSWLLHVLEHFYNSFHTHRADEYFTFPEKINYIFRHPTSSLVVLLLPAFGGLMAGLIVYLYSRDSKGTGTDEMIDAFHNKEGKIDTRIPVFKSLATLFTLPTGGSGGKEGPISFIGAGVGVWVANLAKAGARARRTLMLAGTAAGLGAVFKTPLGGALTAAEMVYKEDIESDALIPCFISSVTAYLVYTMYAGTDPFLNVSGLTKFHFNEMGFYLALGVLCFSFGFLFIKGFNNAKVFIGKIRIPVYVKPAIGGLLTGAIALVLFEVSGTGSLFLEKTIQGHMPDFFGGALWFELLLSLLIVAFVKIVATTLTIGSGGSAGIFGPSLFIGAMLGAAVGIAAQHFIGPQVSVASFMVVGMGAFYSGVANAPIAGIVMIVEMTGSYVLLPPLILVSIFTFILSKQISFYKNQVENRFKSPAHSWEMKNDIIDLILIKNHFPEYRLLAVLKRNTTVVEALNLAGDIHASDFVVVNDKLKYQGMLSLRSVDYETTRKEGNEKIPVSRFMDKSVPYVTPNDQLSKALDVIMRFDVDKVAVVEGEIMVGYIRSKDIFDAYTQQLKQKKDNS